ncbi:branched-chain amino acid transaminase [Candidatus Persebacteraceae bacterium Df01]|jgi:branched-chain amino acid aminotransferase|uniref:Branched-chain-amino-acid aminotransferase n=1 Tax=Candidatus Doriopsillibacter californiensis TaxID=2970740 RepID=A0ABT7QMZ8_9GAMM|nr:branched-chain amino acid transaminase [Candidatus Persebacteraceae bacterium Df01]
MTAIAEREGNIWFDGKMTPWREAKIHVLSHSLNYGVSVFEGVRCYQTDSGPAIFRLTDHTRRFFQSAHIIGMKIPFSEDDINAAQRAVVRDGGHNACYIRPLAFYGAYSLGLAVDTNPVQVIVAAWPWGAYLGEEGMEKGIRVKTSSYARYHVNTTMCRAKVSGNYVNSVLAHKEAAQDGYDESLLLDVDGLVSEGPGENLFIVVRNQLYTPELTSVLSGITRDTVMTLAQDMGYEVVEKRITRDAVYCADEAFFTGTAAEITPIRELDGRVIGSGGRGPITEALQSAFFDCVAGKHPRSANWLTPAA